LYSPEIFVRWSSTCNSIQSYIGILSFQLKLLPQPVLGYIRVKDPLDYSLANTLIPEASSCKYLGIILSSDLSWADQVNYMVKKAWKALHFIMRILKKGNSNTKTLAYMSLVCPILEYWAACWDLYREGQIIALDRVQKKATKFAHHTKSSNWENFGDM
jgi:hypothetical protein